MYPHQAQVIIYEKSQEKDKRTVPMFQAIYFFIAKMKTKIAGIRS